MQRFAILRLFCLVWILPLSGCLGAKFHSDFYSMELQPPQPSHPLVGAWQGSWQSHDHAGTHLARAIISLNSSNRYDVRLEMYDFEPVPGVSNFPLNQYWVEAPDVLVTTTTNQADQFQVKTCLKRVSRSKLVGEAMTLQGTIHADSLQIQFSTNDAVTELDRGGIELHRTIAQKAS